MLNINIWAVIVAAVAQIAIGIAWYGPLFGELRDRLQGLKPGTGDSPASYIGSVVNNLLMSFVMAIIVTFAESHAGIWSAVYGMQVTFCLWLGFMVTRDATMSIWEGRPWKVWLINVSYYFVGFMAMGAILGAWH